MLEVKHRTYHLQRQRVSFFSMMPSSYLEDCMNTKTSPRLSQGPPFFSSLCAKRSSQFHLLIAATAREWGEEGGNTVNCFIFISLDTWWVDTYFLIIRSITVPIILSLFKTQWLSMCIHIYMIWYEHHHGLSSNKIWSWNYKLKRLRVNHRAYSGDVFFYSDSHAFNLQAGLQG